MCKFSNFWNAKRCSSSGASDCDAEIGNFLKNAFDTATVCKAQFPSGAAVSRGLDSDPATRNKDRSWCHLAQSEMLVCVNMCKYLRLCDNNCDFQLNPVGDQDHCGDCRKRKDHEDEEENECKFSKHSPDTDTASVSFLMRKWSNTEVDGQNGNNFTQAQAPILDEVRGETLQWR